MDTIDTEPDPTAAPPRVIVCSYCGDPQGVNPDGSYRPHNCS